jgi:23S rRNA pseudouridine955/2504/2580 synthase
MPPMNESTPASQPLVAKTPVQLVTVDENHDGQRIDNFLIRHLKGVPRTLVYRILRKGEVRVNKGRAKPEQKLKIGDVVRIPPLRLDEPDEPATASNGLLVELESRILYEDKQLIVLNKPSGLAAHGGSGIRLGLIEALRQMRPQEKMLELVHRLDRDTSGCIIIAKKRSALTALHDDLRDGRVDKRYLALVVGRWPASTRDVKVPLLKNELATGGRVVRVSDAGKPCHTGFTIKQLYSGYTLLEAKPYTGRTHQIRVHAKHAGHSLVGDDKYTERALNDAASKLGFKRLFLHAASLTFTLPGGDKIRVEAPLPDDIGGPLARLVRV